MIFVTFSFHPLNGPLTTQAREIFTALFDPLFLRYGHLDRFGFGVLCLVTGMVFCVSLWEGCVNVLN